MIINSNDILGFSTNINIPEGFYYNRENQFSVAVSNDYLNIYVAKAEIIPDGISNIYTREIRLTGTLLYKVSINALISSYNYCCEAVIDNGQSSRDQFLKIKSNQGGVARDYIVLGYLAECEQAPNLSNKNITTILKSINVIEEPFLDIGIVVIVGEFSFLLNAF